MTAPTLQLVKGSASWREVDGEIVGVALGAGEYFAITPSGAALWPALNAGTTRGELVDVLVEQFGIDDERAGADVDAFVIALRGWGLLAE